MGKDKLRKFAEIGTFPNVHQLEDGMELKGQWAEKQFSNNKPIVIELACGKGEYTVNMAEHFPEKNFIGIDFKGNRIWRGAKTALEQNIPNVAFLRIQIENIMDYFAPGEVSEIWITFPDPQPQKSRIKKRLTNPVFLDKYQAITAQDAQIHLKTDSDLLYEYTLETLQELGIKADRSTADLYHSELIDPVLSIKTFYEKKYLEQNKNINYVQWRFPVTAQKHP